MEETGDMMFVLWARPQEKIYLFLRSGLAGATFMGPGPVIL